MKAILTILLLLFAHSLFSQSTYIEGRGVTSQGLWSENTAGISCISQNTFGISVENRFGLSDLSYAQCRVAIPNTYGVVQGHWNNSGNESYAINDWGISFARALSPLFSMGIKGRYKQEKIGYDKQSAVMVDVGLRYQITAQLYAASAISNPFRDSLESTAFHLGLEYHLSKKVSLAIAAKKEESLPLSLHTYLKYFPTENIYLYTSISTQASSNAFGMAFLWKSLAIDAHISYHYYLGLSPQMALTYSVQ